MILEWSNDILIHGNISSIILAVLPFITHFVEIYCEEHWSLVGLEFECVHDLAEKSDLASNSCTVQIVANTFLHPMI